ncbi:MAG: hypothetical protein D6767_10560 [Candidatus Hydrogenedentota bacterium]|nr:MAG: hypothetical protein D6767_10560 [Candidatus Hydrogenedentota bacterium]
MKFLSFLLIVWAPFFFSCTPVKQNQIPSYSLEVSPFHVNFFQVISKTKYTQSETRNLFQKMDALGNEYCKMYWKQKSYNPDKAKLFIAEKYLKGHTNPRLFHPLHDLVSGCFNYYRMNDMHPEKDFILAAKLIPQYKKECYSLGFMQPYFMHAHLNCKKLTMFDIDWRILYGHQQMIDLYANHKMNSAENIQKNIQTLKLGWRYRYDGKPMEERMKAAVTTVCFPRYKDLCTQELLTFHQKFRQLNEIQFELSSLHTMHYKAKDANTAIVVFLSNAIVDFYTSAEDFRLMMKNLQKSLLENQNIYFIHHAAVRQQFGIYKGTKVHGNVIISTLCRDHFLTPPLAERVEPYTTHFDRISITKKTPECKLLL